MECEFCKKTLSTQSALNYHQKNAKYCLKLRNIKNDKFICEWCNTAYAHKQGLDRHKKICKRKDKALIEQYKKDNIEKDIQIAKLQAELAIYKKMSESSTNCVEEIAKQTKVTNTNTNIQNNKWVSVPSFNLLSDEKEQEKLTELLEMNFNEEHFNQGQKGMARFAYQHLLIDSNGTLLYKCLDGRNNFNFKNAEGVVCKDIKAQKLATLLGQRVKPITKSMLSDLSDQVEADELSTLITNFREYNSLDDDNVGFRSELRSLTSE